MSKTKFSRQVTVQTATGQVALSPHQVANLRGQIARNMQNHITLADEVVKGHREWTPTQARVFSNLLNKVIPDLSASYHQHEHNHKNITEMSREELELIASGVDGIIDAEVEEDETDDRRNQGASEQPSSRGEAFEHDPEATGGGDVSTRPEFST